MNGNKLIVCMDANKHIYHKSLGGHIMDPDNLTMSEVVGDFTHQRL